MENPPLPYRNLAGYLREKYGKPLRKICVDGGFTCPNRDGTCGFGGCIFCGERGAGEHIDASRSIREQTEAGLRSQDGYILYFQNFTNTYAPVAVLKERYDAALFDSRIRILDIGTRPDCINEEIADLIASYQEKYEVWVELGLQTANDKTADRIHRGYHIEIFENAVKILAERHIRTIVHLIVGLPGETQEDVLRTADYLSRYELFGVKIHSLYVMQGTKMADLYASGDYTPPTLGGYVDGVLTILSRLSPETIVHRLTGDCPDGMLLAPAWSADKNAVLKAITDRMNAAHITQGCLRDTSISPIS